MGIQGAGWGNQGKRVVAQRIAQAINSKSIDHPLYDPNNPLAVGADGLDLYIKAEAVDDTVKLTMLSDGLPAGNNDMNADHRTHFPEKGNPDPEPSYYQYVNMDLVSNVDGVDLRVAWLWGCRMRQGMSSR